MNWSRNARVFPLENKYNAYLPIDRIMSVIMKEVGYDDWVSLEIFSRTVSSNNSATVINHAERGKASLD